MSEKAARHDRGHRHSSGSVNFVIWVRPSRVVEVDASVPTPANGVPILAATEPSVSAQPPQLQSPLAIGPPLTGILLKVGRGPRRFRVVLRRGATLLLTVATHKVTTKQGQQLLADTCGYLHPGKLFEIFGPSGAGKNNVTWCAFISSAPRGRACTWNAVA